jgi:hypothetical protein
MAWLGATPDKQKVSRLEAIENNTLQTRLDDDEDLPEDSKPIIKVPLEVNLPEIPEAFCHLRELFYLSGQGTSTGYGLAPLSWQEIQAFRTENDLDLTLWERQLLKRMSEAYCAEASKATDPYRPAPYAPQKVDEDVDKIALALKMRDALNAFRTRKN